LEAPEANAEKPALHGPVVHAVGPEATVDAPSASTASTGFVPPA
jgi:hypothetical protein